LVVGLRDHSYSHFFEKKETTNAIKNFLRGEGGEDVVAAFGGPGDTRFHFPTGEWFFDGFTPHAGMVRGAVLFDAKGSILLAALLDLDNSTLNIFVHGAGPGDRFVQYTRRWADRVVERENADYPELRKKHIFYVKLLAKKEGSNNWIAKQLQ
jgi:hypothetical protein